MKKYLDFVSIFIDKMILFVSDGFVVMVGKKNGVIVYFKRDNDNIIDCKCCLFCDENCICEFCVDVISI